MENPKPKAKRQIPLWVLVVVPLVTVGLALVAVAVAWRSSDPDESTRSPIPDPSIQVTSQAFLSCTDCHEDLDKVFKDGLVPQLLYTHEMHFGKGVSECAGGHPPTRRRPSRTVSSPSPATNRPPATRATAWRCRTRTSSSRTRTRSSTSRTHRSASTAPPTPRHAVPS